MTLPRHQFPWLAARAANRELKEKLRLACGQRDTAKGEMDFLDEEIRGIEAEIRRLNIAILEHDNKSGRHALQQMARIAEQDAARASSEFRRRMDAIGFLQPLCASLGFEEHVPAIELLARAAKGARIEKLPEGCRCAKTGPSSRRTAA